MNIVHRPHRNRRTPAIRRLVQETHLHKADFIMPIFVHETLEEKRAISSLPGLYQWSLNDLLEEVEDNVKAGIDAVILFGIPAQKDAQGSAAFDPSGVIQKAIRLIKSRYPELVVIADLCFCEYTDHGHCGVMDARGLNNDDTLPLLGKTAVTYADAGVDMVAPSGMMDGMVGAIRQALDQAGHTHVNIMSYSAKYASGLFGPFREAAGSGDCLVGDRKHHQMNPAQRREAVIETVLDVEEGADIVMIKPGTLYLDIVRDVRECCELPVAVYHVSGEYAMLKAAIDQGIVQEDVIVEELFTSFKRAGADLIISYFSKEMARRLSA